MLELIMNNISYKDPGYAWVMVACVFILSALSFGALASISVFLKPLALDFGWSRGQTSLSYTVISFSSAIFGVFWGYIAAVSYTHLTLPTICSV